MLPVRHERSFARPDWAERIISGRSLLPDFSSQGLDTERADLAVRTCQKLMRSSAEVQFSKVEPTSDIRHPHASWFDELAYSMFLTDHQRRVVREAFLLVPKHSGVANNLAALLLATLILNPRPQAEFGLLAPTREIATLIFRPAVEMIRASGDISPRFKVKMHLGEIEDVTNGARFRIRTFDVDRLPGANLHGAIFYGVQFLRTVAHAAAMRELRGALCGCGDAFLILAGMQSTKPPTGTFKIELDRARATRDGKLDGGVLPLIYEPPPNFDWCNPATFHLFHPGVGSTISTETMVRDKETAERCDFLNEWAAQFLNVQIEDNAEKVEAA